MDKLLIIIFFLLITSITSTKSQVLKFAEIERLPSTINSDSEENLPILSEDGLSLYFVRSFHKQNKGGAFAGQDIWMSTKTNSLWSEPTNQLGVLNNKRNNAVIGIRENGKTLFLLDSYNNTVNGVAFTRHLNGKWTKPEKIPIKGIARDGFIGFYMNTTYDVLLISMKKQDSYGEEDLYVSLKDKSNNWSQPRNLGATINSKGFEISPFLSEDKKSLFFASDGHAGFGDADIFVSRKLYDSWDVWSVPENLGPVINSKKFDAYFTINQDSLVYLSSNRESQHASIYSSSFIFEKTNASQARIDSLIKEAQLILEDLKTINPRTRQELLLSFAYNSFDLTDQDKETISAVLNKTIGKKGLTISLLPFSGEGYSLESERLISNKRILTIKDFLQSKGVSNLDISVKTYSLGEDFKKYQGKEVGIVKIIFNL